MHSIHIGHTLLEHLEHYGYKGVIVSAEHRQELIEEVVGRYQHGTLDPDLYREYLMGFDTKIPTSLPHAKSLILVAAPQPQVHVNFHLRGESYLLCIPPTYLLYTNRQIQTLLTSILSPEGYNLIRASVPLKLLSVKSRLAQYGKNNITYVPGMGSFHRLIAFYSDLPCFDEHWGEAQVMERCNTCGACYHTCPTGAIEPERFLIHAERCLTFHNESTRDLPDWIHPSWHKCLVGCMDCQRQCPVNKSVSTWFEQKESFTEEETESLLQAIPPQELPESIINKLERLDIIESGLDKMFSRNLRVLLENQGALQK